MYYPAALICKEQKDLVLKEAKVKKMLVSGFKAIYYTWSIYVGYNALKD